MPVVSFAGRILPEIAGLSLTPFKLTGWKDSAAGLTMDFEVKINASQFTIECDINKFDPNVNLTSVLMRANDVVRSTVDLACFSTGEMLVVLFDTLTDQHGTVKQLRMVDASLAAVSTAVNNPSRINDILDLIFKEPALGLALHDIIEGVGSFHRAPTHSARAIEAIRHLIAPNEKDRKNQWKQMGNVLNLSESYLRPIADVSIGPRHGDPQHVPGATTSDIARKSWIVMNRFLEYRKRGNKPLLLSDFPLLT